jgi:type VII secretion-associated serine protease mycosin
VARAHGLEAGNALGTAGAPGTGSAPGLVKTNGRPVEQVLAELRQDPNVAYAEPDYVVSLDAEGVTEVTTDDPKLSQQYSLNRMRVRDAWSVTTGASNVIAVLDTGVQFSHPDLTGRLLTGYDFVNGDTNASDDNGHGTWVSGIIAARANDGYGIAGISWSDKILPVKIMNANGSGLTSNLVAGIRWAADHDAKVINMSIGGYPASTSVQDAVNYAWIKGVVLVGAAGNNRREETHYPASHTHVISVSATQADDEFTNWSSYGPKVDVSAPGGSVLTTNCNTSRTGSCMYGGDHIIISGTSFATPNTAGVVALLRAKYPSWTPQQVVDRLISTVDDLGYGGWDKYYGFGRVNAYRAVGGSPAPISVTGSDSLESNNTLAAAKKISLASVVSPTNYPAGDVDYFAVDLPRAGRLDVRVTAVTDTTRPVKSSLPVDPVVELLTTGGTRLALVDNPSNSAATEYASVTVAGATRIIVKVSNWFPNASKVPYTVRADYVDTAAPKVASRFPAPNTAGWNRFVAPTVTFDEPVTNVTTSTVSLRDDATNAAVPITVSYDAATRQARVTVTEQLAALTTYRLSVSGVKDIAGNVIVATSWVFTTGSYGYYDIGSSKFQAEIAWLAESGITVGCGAGRFCPSDPVTRQQMASFLVRALELSPVATDYFTDDTGSSHEGDINSLAAAGVTKGCDPTRFCPTVSVTREQMASFLVRALGLPPASTDYFTDDAGSTHEADVNALAAAGITTGCSPTTFCGGDPVSREQMAAFLERAFGD